MYVGGRLFTKRLQPGKQPIPFGSIASRTLKHTSAVDSGVIKRRASGSDRLELCRRGMWPTRWIVPPEVPALFPALEALNSRRYVGPARKGWARGGVGRSGDIYVHAARSVYTRDTRVILKRMVATLLGPRRSLLARGLNSKTSSLNDWERRTWPSLRPHGSKSRGSTCFYIVRGLFIFAPFQIFRPFAHVIEIIMKVHTVK